MKTHTGNNIIIPRNSEDISDFSKFDDSVANPSPSLHDLNVEVT